MHALSGRTHDLLIDYALLRNSRVVVIVHYEMRLRRDTSVNFIIDCDKMTNIIMLKIDNLSLYTIGPIHL